MYEGNEHFTSEKEELTHKVLDFWRWAYGDFTNNIQRSILAEYIVATAIGTLSVPGEEQRHLWRPFDLKTPEGWRIEVKCAAHVQQWKRKHPERASYSIAPAREYDEFGAYVEGMPPRRHSDCYVFVHYVATENNNNPLDMDLWEFYLLRTDVLDREKPLQKSITLSSLLKMEPRRCRYTDLRSGLRDIMA